jgi:hypothetical protein
MSNEIAIKNSSQHLVGRDVTYDMSFEQVEKFCEKLCKSAMVPKAYVGKPVDAAIAIMYGQSVGLKFMTALNNVAVINGRPALYGDGALALILSQPSLENFQEYNTGDTFYCKIKRKGVGEIVGKFSIEDAKKAGLWGKSGPWSQYPNRMLQMRARGFAMRDAYSDALCGLILAEEAYDLPKADYKVIEEQKEKLLSRLGIEQPIHIAHKVDEASYQFSSFQPDESSFEAHEARSTKNQIEYADLKQELEQEESKKQNLYTYLMNLITARGIPEETITKWKEKAGKDDIYDFSVEQLTKCIEYLRQKDEKPASEII